MPKDFRTFVAIDLPSALKLRIEKWSNRFKDYTDYRWTDTQNLHLTLNFVGSVTEQDITPLCREIESRLCDLPRFSIALGGCGAFPRTSRPRVVWLGVARGEEPVIQAHRRTEALLVEQLYPRDRLNFHPHVTLGRANRGARQNASMETVIQSASDVTFDSFNVEEITIFESVLERQGPRYTPIFRVKLT